MAEFNIRGKTVEVSVPEGPSDDEARAAVEVLVKALAKTKLASPLATVINYMTRIQSSFVVLALIHEEEARKADEQMGAAIDAAFQERLTKQVLH